jgi:hypothetical protein
VAYLVGPVLVDIAIHFCHLNSHACNACYMQVKLLHDNVRSLAVLTCECSETCIMGMHVFSQDDLISIAQFDLDQHQNISSP